MGVRLPGARDQDAEISRQHGADSGRGIASVSHRRLREHRTVFVRPGGRVAGCRGGDAGTESGGAQGAESVQGDHEPVAGDLRAGEGVGAQRGELGGAVGPDRGQSQSQSRGAAGAAADGRGQGAPVAAAAAARARGGGAEHRLEDSERRRQRDVQEPARIFSARADARHPARAGRGRGGAGRGG